MLARLRWWKVSSCMIFVIQSFARTIYLLSEAGKRGMQESCRTVRCCKTETGRALSL